MSHDPDLAARVFSLTESRAWGDLKALALAKVARHEASVSRLIFRTRTDRFVMWPQTQLSSEEVAQLVEWVLAQ